MAFPTTSLLDDFNRADGALGGNWTTPILTGNSAWQVATNQASMAGSPASSYWSASTFGPDSECYATLTASADGNTFEVWVRVDGTNHNGYLGRFTRSDATPGFTTFIYRADSGSLSLLNSNTDSSGAWASTDKFGIEIIGNVIKLYRFQSSWTNVNTNSGDSTYTGANNIGIRAVGTETADDFSGGTIAAAAVPVSDRPFQAIPFM